MFRKMTTTIIVASFILFLSLTAACAVESNATEDLTTAEEPNVKSSNIRNSNNKTQSETNSEKLEKTNENNYTSSGDGFIDVSDAYNRLNAFRTENSVWYWNSDDATKTIFNTNDENRLQPLIRDKDLEETAKKRAMELVKLYSHTRPNGERCFTIYPDDLRAYGENIAYGFKTCKDVTEAWKEDNDPYDGQGHRRNMLSTMFNSVGIAGFKANGVIYWVQAFGYDKNPTPVTQKTSSTVLKKTTTKITAKNKIFKAKIKTKKFSITLKDNNKKAVKKVKVTLKVKGKLYKATTNVKGKATFKINKLTKKGTYKAIIKFKGYKNYKAISKTVKIKIK